MTTETRARVLHICPDFPNTKLYNLLINKLSESEDNIVYVPSREREIPSNCQVYYLGRDFGIIDRVLFFRKQRVIKHDIEQRNLCRNINLIHAHTLFSAGYTAWRIFNRYKIPYVVAVRNTDVNVFLRNMIHLRPVGVKILRDASAVIFISPAYKRFVFNRFIPSHYKSIIEGKSYVLPNGIDDFYLNSSNSNHIKTIDGKRVRLIYVGEVNTNKNISTTLKACELLESHGLNPTLTVIGRITEERFESIKHNRFVKYYPQCPKEEVITHYLDNDIFVMPSLRETFGLVYIEAISQGLPIVYSKGQGVDGYFDDGYVGFSVNSLNESEIAYAIEKIIADYQSISARCFSAAKPFSWSKIASEYRTLYHRIIE